jgi:hypothetical protein
VRSMASLQGAAVPEKVEACRATPPLILCAAKWRLLSCQANGLFRVPVEVGVLLSWLFRGAPKKGPGGGKLMDAASTSLSQST